MKLHANAKLGPKGRLVMCRRVVEEALTTDSPSSRYPVGAPAQLLTRVRGLVPDRLSGSAGAQ